MSEFKSLRKEKIKSVVEHRAKIVMTYWLTRDRAADGQLSSRVDVWLIRPVRRRVDGTPGSFWSLPPGPELVAAEAGPVQAHYGTWTLDYALRECHVFPDDEIQSIRVGPPEGAGDPVAEASS